MNSISGTRPVDINMNYVIYATYFYVCLVRPIITFDFPFSLRHPFPLTILSNPLYTESTGLVIISVLDFFFSKYCLQFSALFFFCS